MYISISVLFVIAIVLFLGGYIVFRRIALRKDKRGDSFEEQFSEYRLSMATEARLRADFSWFDEHRTHEICATSRDGLKLMATVVEAKDPRGIILLFHGYHSNARRDFCMQMRILHNAGYHLIVVDQRSHSRSEGKYVCFGTRESEDVIVWREKAAELYGSDMPVALMGLSMGGATVLMASAMIDKNDTAVRCVVADCPFSSPIDIVSHVMKNFNNIPPFPLISFASFWCRYLACFSLNSPSSAEKLAESHLPALLFHGTADDFVPQYHSEDVISHSPERAKLVLFDGAKHAEAIYYDEKRYTNELLTFLEQNMK
jgi:alpha-beta hydrolase superfamily lysophospholipase